MNQDLLTDNFADGINRAVIKRNFAISKLLLLLSIVWSIVILIDWYIFIQQRNGDAIQGFGMIYNYVILPVSDVIILGLSVYSYFLILKAYRFIYYSLNESDGALMAEGFRWFYVSNVVTAITFVISIIITFANILL